MVKSDFLGRCCFGESDVWMVGIKLLEKNFKGFSTMSRIE